MDIIHLLNALWIKKWIIIILTSISIGAALFFTNNLPKQFIASALIETGFTTNEGIQLTDERFNLQESYVKFNNLLSSMTSGLMYNLLSYRLVLHDLDSSKIPFRYIDQEDNSYMFSQNDILIAKKTFERKLQEKTPMTILDEDSDLLTDVKLYLGYTYTWIKESLSIGRIPNTDYVQVMFFSESRELSAFAVNAYCEEFLEYYTNSKMSKISETVDFYSELIEQKKTELNEKSSELREFKQNNKFLDINKDAENNLSEISELKSQKTEIESDIYRLNLLLSNQRENNDENDNKQINNTNNRKIIELRRRIVDLNNRYTSTNSEDEILKDSLDLIKEQLRNELNKMSSESTIDDTNQNRVNIKKRIDEIIIELETQKSKLNSVNASIYNLTTEMDSYASKEAILNKLEREIELATNEYLNALNKYNEARNKLSVSAASIRLVEKATPPASPESSKRIIMIGFAGISTFSLCVLAILLIEILRGSIKTPSLFEQTVKIDLLGTLGNINIKQLDFFRLFSEKEEREEFLNFKQHLRKLRFEIEKVDGRVFLITSLKRNEGKSLVIVALAFVFSLIDKKVLIIDTNFKNNSLTAIFNTTPNIKLLGDGNHHINSEKFSFQYEPNNQQEQSKDDYVLSTKYKNIYFIGNIGNDKSPEEILFSKDFSLLIEKLKDRFDYIFLEGPSLNEYSDSKELEQYVDKIIPVFSAEQQIKRLDIETIKYLKRRTNSKLAGAILNKINHKYLKSII